MYLNNNYVHAEEKEKKSWKNILEIAWELHKSHSAIVWWKYTEIESSTTIEYFFDKLQPQNVRARLRRVFKQPFSIFLEILVGEKMCEKMCNVIQKLKTCV